LTAPTLIVEDGSGVVGANSYVALADIKAFAANRNINISAFSSLQLIGFAFTAIDYIESFRDRFQGSKTSATQNLQWPRLVMPDPALVWETAGYIAGSSSFGSSMGGGAFSSIPTQGYIDGFPVPNDVIPVQLKNAQCQLVMDQCAGVVLAPSTYPNRQVKVQQIGPLRTEYFGSDQNPWLPAFNNFMQPLLNDTQNGFLQTVRI